MQRPFYILDVFAEDKYQGNQLAVVCQSAGLTTAEMQQIARETNFSETTFVDSDRPRDGGYDVRIFTPAAEIPFAGHPTLGTAHVIRQQLEESDEINLNLSAGPIRVTFERTKEGNEIAWFYRSRPEFGAVHSPASIAALLGLDEGEIDTRFPVQEVSMGVPFTTIPLKSLSSLRKAKFRLERLSDVELPEASQSLFLFCNEARDPNNQVSARLFAPLLGVPEDPATGSANACLSGYLLEHNYFRKRSVDIRVEQGHEIGRPSLLHIRGELSNDGTMDISVGGQVIPTAQGVLI